MKGTIFTILVCTMLAAVFAAPRLTYGGPGVGYVFVASRPGSGYDRYEGVATVQATQNAHSYDYGVMENSAHHSKQMYQNGNFQTQYSIPVAAYYNYNDNAGAGFVNGHNMNY